MNRGEIEVFNDSKKVLNDIEKSPVKESDSTLEVGAAVEEMYRNIDKAKVNIVLKYANTKPR